MKTIVIGDIHGDAHGLMAILRATEAIDGDNRRSPGTRVIQLGDLIHGGMPRSLPREGVDDCKALLLGMRLCDEILIGNHELPHLFPAAGFPAFGGMREVREETFYQLQQAWKMGKFVPATSVGDWLLTHAGLMPAYQGFGATAAETAERLGLTFRERVQGGPSLALLDGVGRKRGGTHARGGIFWCDWTELIGASAINPVKQIVGHTPQEAGYANVGPYWCVDSGAALSGLVSAITTEDDGATWVPVVTQSDPATIAAFLARAAGSGEGGQG